jgi:hypothetical protein
VSNHGDGTISQVLPFYTPLTYVLANANRSPDLGMAVDAAGNLYFSNSRKHRRTRWFVPPSASPPASTCSTRIRSCRRWWAIPNRCRRLPRTCLL